jgi:hypothetical protein
MPSLFSRWAAALLLLAPLALRAVDFQPLSIEALSARADWVVQGKVLSKTCLRDPAGRIYTRVELDVLDVWKGTTPSRPLRIVHGGGVLGDEQARVSGQVDYGLGEEVVAFLVRNTRGEGVTVGLMQGKFHVWAEGGIQFAASPFHGTAQQEPASPARTRENGSVVTAAHGIELGALKKRVLVSTSTSKIKSENAKR